MVQVGLPVRQGRGDPVHQDADSPNPELGPGPHSPEDDAFPHRVVVPVLDLKAGECLKGLLDGGPGAPFRQRFGPQDGDGEGGLVQAKGSPEDPDLDPRDGHRADGIRPDRVRRKALAPERLERSETDECDTQKTRTGNHPLVTRLPRHPRHGGSR